MTQPKPLPNAYDDFNQALHAFVQGLPSTWMPRRPQPEWDRDFGGSADIQTQMSGQTDLAKDHINTAMAFSAVILDGFEDEGREGTGELAELGVRVREYLAKGKNQDLDADA